MNKQLLSIVIVNYNTYSFLKKCLASIIENSSDIDYEIIVVDNNSPEKDILDVRNDFSQVKLILNDRNKGFGDGCNIGAAAATGNYLLFINPDVQFSGNVNSSMLKLMESDPGIGVSSPIYFEDDGNVTYTYNRFPGFDWNISEAYANVFRRIKGKIFGEKLDYENKVFYVDWVMGSYMLIRRECFERVNGFDTNIFLYYEDIDLQFRIKKEGYKIAYNGFVHISHYKRSSVRSEKGENLMFHHMTRSNLIYMYKHFSFTKRNIIRFIHITGVMFRVISLPLRSEYKNKKQKMHQYADKFRQYVLVTKNDLFKKN